MGQKKKTEICVLPANIQEQYLNELDTNPQYSLSVDPLDKYHMSDEQKRFIEYYVQFKSIPTAAEFCGIDMDVARDYFISYASQQEIRRINLAMYHRQFQNRLLSLDAIGGYLTSLLTDYNVPLGEQLPTRDKLKVAQMLMDLNKLKIEAFEDPNTIMLKDLDVQIKDLSVETIQRLIETDREKLTLPTNGLTHDSLSPEEKAYLSTLSTEELLSIIEKTNRDEGSENEQGLPIDDGSNGGGLPCVVQDEPQEPVHEKEQE